MLGSCADSARLLRASTDAVGGSAGMSCAAHRTTPRSSVMRTIDLSADGKGKLTSPLRQPKQRKASGRRADGPLLQHRLVKLAG